jgi:hypothetical protein
MSIGGITISAVNEKEASEVARAFIAKNIDLQICTTLPPGTYDVNLEREYVFSIHDNSINSIGSSPYISVSKITGQVRYLGNLGE